MQIENKTLKYWYNCVINIRNTSEAELNHNTPIHYYTDCGSMGVGQYSSLGEYCGLILPPLCFLVYSAHLLWVLQQFACSLWLERFIYYLPEVRRGEYRGLGVFLLQFFPLVKIQKKTIALYLHKHEYNWVVKI